MNSLRSYIAEMGISTENNDDFRVTILPTQYLQDILITIRAGKMMKLTIGRGTEARLMVLEGNGSIIIQEEIFLSEGSYLPLSETADYLIINNDERQDLVILCITNNPTEIIQPNE